MPLGENRNNLLPHRGRKRKHSHFDLRQSRRAPIDDTRRDRVILVQVTRTKPLFHGHSGSGQNVLQDEGGARVEIIDRVKSHHGITESLNVAANPCAQIPVPLKAEIRRTSALRKLIIEHEPHLINRLAELNPMVIEVIDLLHAIFPFRIEQLISVVIFSSKPCAHKTFQFLQRESAIFSAKRFLRTIATGTGKAAALVFLSAAAGTGVISADFTHDSIQESYSPDSTRRSKEGPLLASRS